MKDEGKCEKLLNEDPLEYVTPRFIYFISFLRKHLCSCERSEMFPRFIKPNVKQKCLCAPS